MMKIFIICLTCLMPGWAIADRFDDLVKCTKRSEVLLLRPIILQTKKDINGLPVSDRITFEQTRQFAPRGLSWGLGPLWRVNIVDGQHRVVYEIQYENGYKVSKIVSGETH